MAFIGSSFTFGYPWQEPVIGTRQYADLNRDQHVLNISMLAAGISWMNQSALCAVASEGLVLDAIVLEIPVVNEVSTLMHPRQDSNLVRPLAQCEERGPVHGYFGFVAAHPRGIGWLSFLWDSEAYSKNEESLSLQKVPPGYFVTREQFARVEASYRERIAQLLTNAKMVSRAVYVYPSPVFLPGATQIEEDADAIQRQLDVVLEACRTVAGITCLDPTRFYFERDYYYNLTHLNQRGHRQIAEWLSEAVDIHR